MAITGNLSYLRNSLPGFRKGQLGINCHRQIASMRLDPNIDDVSDSGKDVATVVLQRPGIELEPSVKSNRRTCYHYSTAYHFTIITWKEKQEYDPVKLPPRET
ncbi:hypothetical protein C8J56DRAFT_886831 [Mycena floridula]|nr:hypothetical protein C8J56DRAFT_886831 [Mycena floridula]